MVRSPGAEHRRPRKRSVGGILKLDSLNVSRVMGNGFDSFSGCSRRCRVISDSKKCGSSSAIRALWAQASPRSRVSSTSPCAAILSEADQNLTSALELRSMAVIGWNVRLVPQHGPFPGLPGEKDRAAEVLQCASQPAIESTASSLSEDRKCPRKPRRRLQSIRPESVDLGHDSYTRYTSRPPHAPDTPLPTIRLRLLASGLASRQGTPAWARRRAEPTQERSAEKAVPTRSR